MMYFTSSLSIISPKNRAWKKLVDWIRRFEHILILDECSLDALKLEIEAKVNEINAEHPKLKPIIFSGDNSKISGCISARVMSCGCPDTVFNLNYCVVKSTYAFLEDNSKETILLDSQKGGQSCLQARN